VITPLKRIAVGQRASARGMRRIALRATALAFIAPGDRSTAVCMAYDTKLRLEIPEVLQRSLCVSANEEVTFTRLEGGPHHDGVRFANGAEVALQKLGPGVKGYIYDALLSPLWKAESAEVM